MELYVKSIAYYITQLKLVDYEYNDFYRPCFFVLVFLLKLWWTYLMFNFYKWLFFTVYYNLKKKKNNAVFLNKISNTGRHSEYFCLINSSLLENDRQYYYLCWRINSLLCNKINSITLKICLFIKSSLQIY